jgi:hypothetical protein
MLTHRGFHCLYILLQREKLPTPQNTVCESSSRFAQRWIPFSAIQIVPLSLPTEGRLRTTDKFCANVVLKKVPELAPILGQPKRTPNCALVRKFDVR